VASLGPHDQTADLLERDLTDAREHLAATSEVLLALGRSGSDLEQILGAVLEGARQLCRADCALVYLLEDDAFRVAGTSGVPEDVTQYIREHPFAVDRGSLIGRVALSRRPGQIEDVLRDPEYARTDAQRVAGFRTVVAAPLFVDDDLPGVLNLWRRNVAPFDSRETTLLAAFAAHAAVAIRNARLMRTLELRGAELEVAGRHKSEFLASMSHELRTPLNAVIGFSEVLLERMFGDINERQEGYLRDILASGKHLLELLNDILDLSKVEAGAMVLATSPVDVADTVEHVVSMMRERAVRKDLVLVNEVGPDAGRLEADELRLRQVLLNLLSNAVKFTSAGGTVRVFAERGPDAVVLSVADTGPGIPASEQERIFDSFQQGSWTTHKQEGTGLGLTLCKRIVELHGGDIAVVSEVGAGSTFTVRLPVRPGLDLPEAAAGAGDRPVVLVVEDDPGSAELMEAYLTGTDYEVVVARDGEAGLEAVRNRRPSAVLLDIRLPGLVGWDVLAAMRADPATAGIPVVVVSVLDERAHGLRSGAAAYLVKPVSREDVLTALDDVLAPGVTAVPR
jgi:signal transduction histidine kinase/ActR/RegA family two-component response regulator